MPWNNFQKILYFRNKLVNRASKNLEIMCKDQMFLSPNTEYSQQSLTS